MARPRLLAGVLAGALAIGLTACGSGSSSVASDCKPAHTFPTIAAGELTVGVYDLPPFISTRGDGGMSGVDADILRAIAAKECLEIKPSNTSASAMVPGVQNGRLDVAVGDWYRTTERAAIVAFTDPIYLDEMAIVSPDGISTVEGLVGKTVGTVDGYLWVQDLQKVLGDSLKLYPAGANMQQDLKAGRIQAGIDSYGSAASTLAGSPDLKIEKAQPDPRVAASEQAAQTAFILPKGNQAMVDAFNADLAALRADGTLTKILTEHGLEPSAADVGEPRLIG
jgi:polar amino acid transport system substrate-binding protein